MELAAWRAMAGESHRLAPVLLALLAVTAVIRFPTLGQHELWLDEASMFFDARSQAFASVSRLHVLHVKILGWFLATFGESPFALRLWSAIAGTLAVPIIAMAGAMMAPGHDDTDHRRTKRWAIVAGVLAALSPYLVFYSQDANYYGAMTLFASLQWLAIIAFVRGACVGATAIIVGAGLASHFTHPLGSLMTASAAVTALGALALDGRLRAQWIALSPARWIERPAVPIVVVSLAVATWLAWEPAQSLIPSLMKRGERPPTPDVTWHPMFFVRTFSVYAMGLVVDRHATLQWIGGAMLAGMLAGWGRAFVAGRQTRVVAILLALATTAAIAVTFTIRHHGFYPRYFTFLVPGFVLMGAVAINAAQDRLLPRGAAMAWLPCAAVAIPMALSTALLFSPARRNAAAMTDVLATRYQAGDVILIPERADMQQTAFYFPRARPPIPLESRIVVESADWLDQTTRSFLVHQLAARKRTWILSLRRGFQRPATRALIEEQLGAPAYRGWSVEGSDFDAMLIEWTNDKPIALPHAARREGDRVIEPEPSTTGSDVHKIGPFDSIQFTDDRRNREATLDDGTPVLRRRFDGSVSHLLYTSPTEPRAITVEVAGRAPDADKPLFVALAINGIHQGTWPVIANTDEPNRVVPIHTGIVPPPGNARIDVHGFTPRTGYDPFNEWEYGGLSLRRPAEGASPIAPTWESTGVRFVKFPESVLRWEDSGPMPTSNDYVHRISPDVRGPSGARALSIDLGEVPSTAYARFYGQPIAVGAAEYVAYSTYLMIDGTRSHAVQLSTMWIDADGKPMGSASGTQQFLTARFCHGWSRFVEIAPVPADAKGRLAAFAMPGVMVFPPDPAKPTTSGRVWVDAIASLHDATGPFAEPSLDPSMVFDAVVRDGVPMVATAPERSTR